MHRKTTSPSVCHRMLCELLEHDIFLFCTHRERSCFKILDCTPSSSMALGWFCLDLCILSWKMGFYWDKRYSSIFFRTLYDSRCRQSSTQSHKSPGRFGCRSLPSTLFLPSRARQFKTPGYKQRSSVAFGLSIHESYFNDAQSEITAFNRNLLSILTLLFLSE